MPQYVTRDPDLVRAWADERGARPSTVAAGQAEDHGAPIRLVPAGDAVDDAVNEISWGVWFSKFLENDLVLLYEDETADGQRSDFYKLLSAEAAQALDGDWRGDGANSSGVPDRSAGHLHREGPTAL